MMYITKFINFFYVSARIKLSFFVQNFGKQIPLFRNVPSSIVMYMFSYTVYIICKCKTSVIRFKHMHKHPGNVHHFYYGIHSTYTVRKRQSSSTVTYTLCKMSSMSLDQLQIYLQYLYFKYFCSLIAYGHFFTNY